MVCGGKDVVWSVEVRMSCGLEVRMSCGLWR